MRQFLSTAFLLRQGFISLKMEGVKHKKIIYIYAFHFSVTGFSKKLFPIFVKDLFTFLNFIGLIKLAISSAALPIILVSLSELFHGCHGEAGLMTLLGFPKR